MKAVVYLGPGELSYEEVDVPQLGPGDLLVRTKAALTCGTDVKTYRRGHHLMEPPMLFGHEFAGEVARVGEGVTDFAEGVRVVAANSAPCGYCFFCQRNKPNLCDDILFNWGAFAEYVRVPARIVRTNVHEIPPELEYEEAAMLEPLACVVLGNEAADVSPGDTVVVAGGGGPIGLMHLQLAKHNGAEQVVVIDLKDSRLGLAQQLGATHVVNPGRDDPVAAVKDLTQGRGADVTIETAGLPEVWEMALELVRKGGTAVLFGGCPAGSHVSVQTDRIHYDELTIRGVFHHTPTTVTRALELLRSGVVDAKRLISGRVPLRDTETALKQVLSGEAVKMTIIPSAGQGR